MARLNAESSKMTAKINKTKEKTKKTYWLLEQCRTELLCESAPDPSIYELKQREIVAKVKQPVLDAKSS